MFHIISEKRRNTFAFVIPSSIPVIILSLISSETGYAPSLTSRVGRHPMKFVITVILFGCHA